MFLVQSGGLWVFSDNLEDYNWLILSNSVNDSSAFVGIVRFQLLDHFLELFNFLVTFWHILKREQFVDEKNTQFDYSMFHFTNGFYIYHLSKKCECLSEDYHYNRNNTQMKALFACFSIFFMESTALISRWLLRWNLLFCLDMMVNCNKILTLKWNSFKARLIS